MLNTYKVYDQLSVVTDTENIVIVEQNINGQWDVFVPSQDEYIANDIDTLEAAEYTAFQWLMVKV